MANNAEQFAISETDFDGYPLIVNVNRALRKHKQKQKSATPWFLSISTPLAHSDERGLPDREEATHLNLWEQIVEREIAPTPFVFAGRVTWNGNRELLYYVEEPQAAVGRLQALINSGRTRPFAFRSEMDQEWSKISVYLK